jgi:hypothetical protein
MSPFRWDVLLVGFVLALPVIGLGLRGDLSTEEVLNRMLWCLGAGWAAVAVLRFASTPRPPSGRPAPRVPRPGSTDPTGPRKGTPA